ncbi:YjgN family protein [Glaciecola siphonariae]|uniref:YjgN family protein n=1 Tax=Glaciecola siphonariae TaxID=521012 RepID=A0ABV9M184_9ALTE
MSNHKQDPSNIPDFSAYTLDELIAAKANIDADIYPERLALIDQIIAQRSADGTHSSEHDSKRERAGTNTNTTQAHKQILRTVPVKFLGSGSEFFKIWIVNLLLSIVTFGVYSAWATVRNNRYLYSNVDIDGHRLAYLAKPIQILIGRAIGLLLFVAYYLLTVFSPVAAGFFILLIFVLTPVFVCLSLRFKMRMTAYRNVRFGFTIRYARAIAVFVGYGLLALFTLGFLYPLLFKKVDEFIYENMTYGDREFNTSLDNSEYYMASIGAVVIGLLSIIALAALGSLIGFALSQFIDEQSGGLMISIGVMISYIFTFAIASAFYQALIRNHVFANTDIDGVASFKSSVKMGGLIKLRLVNFALLIVSLGFAMPWIKVRNAIFFSQATEVEILPGYEEVLAGAGESANAVGDEVSSIFDVDVSIG